MLIYFDQPTKIEVLNRMAEVLAPDGYLSLGAAETVVGLTAGFKPHPELRGIFQPGEAIAANPPAKVISIDGARQMAAVAGR